MFVQSALSINPPVNRTLKMIVSSIIHHIRCTFRAVIAAIAGSCYNYIKEKNLS